MAEHQLPVVPAQELPIEENKIPIEEEGEGLPLEEGEELTPEEEGDEDLDPFDGPVPGESLTSDPDAPAPYEQAPQFTDADTAMEELFFNITEDENLDNTLDLIRGKMPLEDIAQVVLFSGFREGMFNPDLMLMLIEPTIFLLIYLAQYANIDPVLYPEDEFDFADEGETTPRELDESNLPEGIKPSLLENIKGKLKEK